MLSYLRDITSTETRVSFPSKLYSSLDFFCGRAVCINVSKITMQGVIDPSKLKQVFDLEGLDILDYDILVLYTGHYDRYYNTCLWDRSRPFLTYSAISYLASMGIKNICIDSPSPLGSLATPINTDMVFTTGLCNIGHLCSKSFLYIGFPLSASHPEKKYLLRAVALQAIL